MNPVIFQSMQDELIKIAQRGRYARSAAQGVLDILPGDIVIVGEGVRKKYKNPLAQIVADTFRMGNKTMQGSFSHAALVTGDNKVVDAVTKGVRETNLDRLINNKDFVVLRTNASPEKIKKAINFANEQVGKRYSYADMLKSGIALTPPKLIAKRLGVDPGAVNLARKKAFQCGGLVSCSFNAAGHSLAGRNQPGASLMSPAQILASPKTTLVYADVPGLIVPGVKVRSPAPGNTRGGAKRKLQEYFGKKKVSYVTAAGPIYTGNMPKSMGTGMVSAQQAQQMTQMPGVRSMRRGGVVPKGKTQVAVLHGKEAVVPLGKDGRPTKQGKKVLKQAEKTAEVEYRGRTFPGYNKPIRSDRKNKKKMVLVKRGDKIKLVHFGQKGYEDFTQHKDKKRQKNYLTRSAGIRNKSGKLTKDDPFSPNYWARRELW